MIFRIKGESAELVIDIKSRNNSDVDDYWDGNWINADIRINIPGYQVFINGDLRAEEIQGFLESVKRMNGSLSGFAELKSMEDFIGLRGNINKVGQVEWVGKTIYPVGVGAELTFKFQSDQSYLPILIAELEQAMKVFPVKRRE